jgi:glycosyltransferase involved in cell wall biosynthesis
MKIAMIGHKRIPSREGGIEIVVEELAKRLVAQGCQVDVYNRSGAKKRQRRYHGIRLITIPTFPNRQLNALVYAKLASIRALFGAYDVIHYHAEGPCLFLWIPRLFGIRVVATIHGLDWQRAKWGGFASQMLRCGEKTAARQAHEIIVLSQNVKAYFKTTYGREVHFIPNGVTKPTKYPAKLITEKYGLEKDGYILFLARLVPEKGAHYLIKAYLRMNSSLKLVIAGGSSHTDEYVAKLRRKVKDNENIIMTDFVEGRELEELYSNAYIFVVPSDVEGMALNLLEAMSYGNCCLVSDIPENAEVVEDKALLFRKGDVRDLREKLELLLANPEMVEDYQQGASDFICSKYNWDEVTEQTMRVYNA